MKTVNKELNRKKDSYRSYFIKISPFIRMKLLYEPLGIRQPNFSSFMRGNNTAISEDSLKELKIACINLGNRLKE